MAADVGVTAAVAVADGGVACVARQPASTTRLARQGSSRRLSVVVDDTLPCFIPLIHLQLAGHVLART